MAVVARVGVPFDLKSTALSGLALVLRRADLESLVVAMAERFGTTPGVFSHEAVVIDLSALVEIPEVEVDFLGLIGLLESHHLLPAGVRGGTEALRQAALAVGLGDVSDDPTGGPAPRAEPPPADRSPTKTAAKPALVAGTASPLETTAGTAPWPAVATAELAVPPAAAAIASASAAIPSASIPMVPIASASTLTSAVAPTLIVDRPLRSGQQVYAKGGDLVVLATVNVGAEVIADGSIHVYGPLRGKAVAGAKGNVDARIFSTCMEPQLLAIAGTYRTTENPLPADVVGRAAQIRLEGERLVFEPIV